LSPHPGYTLPGLRYPGKTNHGPVAVIF